MLILTLTCVICFDGFSLYQNRRITTLKKLAFVGNSPRHVT